MAKKGEKGVEALKIEKIVKRNGIIADFDQNKITNAIFKAANAVGGKDLDEAKRLSNLVTKEILSEGKKYPTVEEIQDAVEKVLIKEGHAKTAKSFILYRAKRGELRQAAIESQKGTDKEKSALLDMFAHKSKLASLIGYDRLESYKELIFHLKDQQKAGMLPIHKNYLNNNEMATTIYQRKYFLKNLQNDLIEKRPEDVFARMSAFMAAVENKDKQKEWAEKFYTSFYKGEFLPGGRVIAGAGDLYRLKTLANCFVTVIEDDNLESIYAAAFECARTYSYGGGIGLDISILRPKDAIVHNAADQSTGSVSFMELYSLTTGLIGQSGRRGALMITIDVKHPDSQNFINVKKIPSWVTKQIVEQSKASGKFSESQLREITRRVRENTQVRFANISLKVSDEFLQAVEEQNKYNDEFLIYEKDKSLSTQGILQGGRINYSFGIPSKQIQKYTLLKDMATISQLNAFLAEHISRTVTEEELSDISRRDMFGDFIISTPDKDFAVKRAGDFMLYFNSPQTGEIKRMIKARELWNAFIAGNYKTAEPGLIFWTTMTKYSPSNYVGRPIASTNPCVAADSLIATGRGIERIDRVQDECIIVDRRTYNNTSHLATIQYGCELVKPTNRMITGYKECYKIETKSGYELTATPDHKVFTTNGWKEIAELTEQDTLLIQSGEGRFNSDAKLPFAVKNKIKGRNGRAYKLNLPAAWSRELGILLGWFIGDGFIQSRYHKAGLVFAEEDEEARRIIQPIFEDYCNREIKQIKYPNGCVQVRSSSKFVIDFLKQLGVKETGNEREVPFALFTATDEAVVGFLEGLFSSDGTIGLGSKSRNYVRLNSGSLKLLKQVQLLLLNLGVRSAIYDRSTASKTFRYVNKNGETIKYKTTGKNYELNISKENAARFIAKIVFLQQKNTDKVALLKQFEFYKETFTDKVKLKEPVGIKEVWDITEPTSHSFIANGFVVHNCGEVPLEDGGACNLGSLNLSRFVTDGYTQNAKIDWAAIENAVTTVVRFLDNVVTWNETLNALEKQRNASSKTRRVGLGIMGIADMLNQLGLGYDSADGVQIMERVMNLIANTAYKASAMLAQEKGISPVFEYGAYSQGAFFQEALSEETKELIKQNGLRNIALLSIAPTGTISNIALGYSLGEQNFIGVSGGIEPIFAPYYTRRSESFEGKTFKVFHSTVDAYLEQHKLKEKAQQSNEAQLRTIIPEHFFRTAHHINPEKRVMIQGICQRNIDHSISSTVNLPEDIEPEVISEIYLLAWKNKLKGITIYRDGSRFPILSVETERTEFQDYKERTFCLKTKEGEQFLKADDVLTMENGKLETVYHSIKKNLLGKALFEVKENGEPLIEKQQLNADNGGIQSARKLGKCPSCEKVTLKVEGGCVSCLNDECGYSQCDL